jgi:hypothetical protein
MNKNSLKVVQYRIRLKQRLIEYKGDKCQICGYAKRIPGAYHFHHRDPKEKSLSISGSTLGLDRLKKEADKCDLLCANCHAEVHDESWKDNREKAFLNKRKPKIEKNCGKCGNLFLPKRKEQKYCGMACVPTRFHSPVF